jgi:hypothetical protein
VEIESPFGTADNDIDLDAIVRDICLDMQARPAGCSSARMAISCHTKGRDRILAQCLAPDCLLRARYVCSKERGRKGQETIRLPVQP